MEDIQIMFWRCQSFSVDNRGNLGVSVKYQLLGGKESSSGVLWNKYLWMHVARREENKETEYVFAWMLWSDIT